MRKTCGECGEEFKNLKEYTAHRKRADIDECYIEKKTKNGWQRIHIGLGNKKQTQKFNEKFDPRLISKFLGGRLITAITNSAHPVILLYQKKYRVSPKLDPVKIIFNHDFKMVECEIGNVDFEVDKIDGVDFLTQPHGTKTVRFVTKDENWLLIRKNRQSRFSVSYTTTP